MISTMIHDFPPLAIEARSSSGVKKWKKLGASSPLVRTNLCDDDHHEDDDDVDNNDNGEVEDGDSDTMHDHDDDFTTSREKRMMMMILPLQELSYWDQTQQRQEARQPRGTSILTGNHYY